MTPRFTVAEAISWIGFGDAQPLANWGKFMPAINKWPVQPPDSLVVPLKALALNLSTQEMDVEVTARARSLIKATGQSAATLVRQLERDLVEKQAFDKRRIAAQSDLQDAITSGQVTVYAAPEHPKYAPRVPVDPDLMDRFSLIIDVHGCIGPKDVRRRYDGPKFVEAAFEPAAIKNAWPPPPAVKPARWMLNEARKYLKIKRSKAKRDDLLRGCIAATKCTHREAIAAYRALPPDVRRSQGHHDR